MSLQTTAWHTLSNSIVATLTPVTGDATFIAAVTAATTLTTWNAELKRRDDIPMAGFVNLLPAIYVSPENRTNDPGGDTTGCESVPSTFTLHFFLHRPVACTTDGLACNVCQRLAEALRLAIYANAYGGIVRVRNQTIDSNLVVDGKTTLYAGIVAEYVTHYGRS